MKNQHTVFDRQVIQIGENAFSGISCGYIDSQSIQPRIDAISYSIGWIVKNNRVVKWQQCGFLQKESKLYVLSSCFGGQSLYECLFDQSSSGYQKLTVLSKIANALDILHRSAVEVCNIHIAQIILMNDGGVLFVSNDVVQLVCDYQSASDALKYSVPFNHAKLFGEKRYSFAIAVMAYIALTRSLPWDVETTKDLVAHMQSGLVLSPHYFDATIDTTVANELLNILTKPKRFAPRLSTWTPHINQWLNSSVKDRESNGQLAERNTRNAHALYLQRKKFLIRLKRIKKNWGKIMTVVSLMLVAITAVNYFSDSSFGAPWVLYNNPSELLVDYYDSYNNLNSTRIERLVDKGIAQKLVVELKTIRSQSRLQAILQLQSPLVNPYKWIQNGRPTLSDRRSLYGYDTLGFEEVHRDQDSATYIVKFRKWLPHQYAIEHDVNGPGSSVGYVGTERITLRLINRVWNISSIELIDQQYF